MFVLWIIGVGFTYGFIAGDEKLSISGQITLTALCLVLWPLFLGFEVKEAIKGQGIC